MLSLSDKSKSKVLCCTVSVSTCCVINDKPPHSSPAADRVIAETERVLMVMFLGDFINVLLMKEVNRADVNNEREVIITYKQNVKCGKFFQKVCRHAECVLQSSKDQRH